MMDDGDDDVICDDDVDSDGDGDGDDDVLGDGDGDDEGLMTRKRYDSMAMLSDSTELPVSEHQLVCE